ncbi:MAG TPA: hypothetical protein VM554_13055 [Acidisarcina sp.]|nr:hypothetical protein [Acidisarcina sp.]
MWEEMDRFINGMLDRMTKQKSAVQVVDGQPYALKADGTLDKPVLQLAPQFTKPSLQVSTLGALVDIVHGDLDSIKTHRTALHIVDPLTVDLLSLEADDFGRRHLWARASHRQETPFVFGKYEQPEDFLIKFRASFLFNDEAVKVQQLCSSVGSGDAVLVLDDGISQEVQIKSGTVTRASIALPADGVPLIPWRTFRDAHPVESKFLLRMKGVKDSLPQIALFEIDAKWPLETKHAIKKYFEQNLPEVPVIA